MLISAWKNQPQGESENVMKSCRLTALISILLIAASVLLSGCGAQNNDPLCGAWAYNHAPETPVLTIENNGSAVFDGKSCACRSDDSFLYLTADGATTAMRYELNDDGMYLYEPTEYTYDGEGTPDGLVVRWVNEQGWDFEFTAQGTFIEDGYFPGRYSVNEAEDTFKLMYNDPFEDTTCYYHIDGKEMLVEYPWHMVRAK